MEPHNIEKIGPGVWHALHLSAAHAKTPDQIKATLGLIEVIKDNFFCMMCRNHFQSNYEKFPPPKHNNNHALFDWTVAMHNDVNQRNGKPQVSPSEVLKYYIGEFKVCEKDCGHAGNHGRESIIHDSKPDHQTAIIDALQISPKHYPRMRIGGRN